MRDLLNDHFVRDLHRRLYAPVWEWGGRMRSRETNIGIAALVRIHPFVDGNGRVTRLMADLVYLAGQTGWEPIYAYDWELDRTTYIRLLGESDKTRTPSALAAFIPVINLEVTD